MTIDEFKKHILDKLARITAKKEEAKKDLARIKKITESLTADPEELAFFYSNFCFLVRAYSLESCPSFDVNAFKKIQAYLTEFFDLEPNKKELLNTLKNLITKYTKKSNNDSPYSYGEQKDYSKTLEMLKNAETFICKKNEKVEQALLLIPKNISITEEKKQVFVKAYLAFSDEIERLKPSAEIRLSRRVEKSEYEIAEERYALEDYNDFSEPDHYKTVYYTVENNEVTQRIKEKEAELEKLVDGLYGTETSPHALANALIENNQAEEFLQTYDKISAQIQQFNPIVEKTIQVRMQRTPDEISWDRECAASHGIFGEPEHYKFVDKKIFDKDRSIVKKIKEKEKELTLFVRNTKRQAALLLSREIHSLAALCRTALFKNPTLLEKRLKSLTSDFIESLKIDKQRINDIVLRIS